MAHAEAAPPSLGPAQPRWIGPDAGRVHRCPPPRGGVLVNGVRIDPRTPAQLLETLDGFLTCGEPHVVNFLAVDPVARSQSRPDYRGLLNKAEVNLADGLPVAWAARSLGQPTDRITGTDAFALIVRHGLERGTSHYLYGGGTPDDVLRLTDRLATRFPGIRIAGTHAPPFRDLTEEDLDASAEAIRASGARAVWIGLGTPKQHEVGQRLREREAAPLIFCVGAAFDFVSGTKKRAPSWMRDGGLEWVYRLASEPRRLWRRYLVGNPVFVAGYALGRLSGPPRRSPPFGGEVR